MAANLQTSIRSILQAIAHLSTTADFRLSHLELLKALGYSSDKAMPIPGADPTKFIEIAEANTDKQLHPDKALLSEWTKADILFQLTDEELSGQQSLFSTIEIKPGLLQSYLFFAIELSGSDYSRTALSGITRQLNGLFPMPVMVLFSYDGTLSIAVINRRLNKRESHKDVLGKVTLIHGIDLAEPHRGHLEILESFSVPALSTKKRPIDSFDSLHTAWEEVFNVELLNKKFYRELSNWYFWAMHHCHFPLLDEKADRYFLFHDREKVREHEAKNLIRLLTRILFVWFIKQKNLVPDAFFDPDAITADFLKDFDPNSKETRYYKAILQNLFFASLNQTHGKREFRKSGQHQNTTTLLRYKSELKNPQAFVDAVEHTTPFLNGGLFDCLDYPHPTKKGPQGGAVIVYEDGFSDRKDNPLVMPDFLFFGSKKTVNLSDDYGDKKRSGEEVRGLIHILNGYKFTIVENTPIEQEIALDPELLGQVFENLLASYNEETKTTARKQTGSFYTPRSIVDYMVDESLKAHLKQALIRDAGMTEDDTQTGLDILFTYTEKEHPFIAEEVGVLICAIDACKILDPACGSGAFPMGALQKLVYILGKLDPGDELWEQRQLVKVDKLIEAAQDFDDATFRERAIADAEAQRADIEEAFAKNELGYGRKLYLIENCLYGVDIQSIATQVSKLRFFISLIVDQKVNRERENFGVRPLPNLETKFVTADTLIQIEKPQAQGELFELTEVSELQKELKRVRHDLFSAKTPRTKRKHRERDKELRIAIADELKQNSWSNDTADKLAAWDPYDQNASTPYFDPEWMFGVSGFDVVIGNPPYGATITNKEYFKSAYKHQDYQLDTYLLFIERGLSLLNIEGIQSFIIPNTWLPSITLKSIRKFIFGESKICSIVDVRSAVFAAVVDTTIVTQLKKHDFHNVFPVVNYTENGFEFAYEQDQDRWYEKSGAPINLRLNPKLLWISQLIDGHDPLGLNFTVTQGSKLYQTGKGKPPQTKDMVKAKPFTATTKKDGFRPLLRGKHAHPYFVEWNQDLWVKYGDWLAEPRKSAGFDDPIKIVIRQTGDSLIAAIDDSRSITMDNLYTIRQSNTHTDKIHSLCSMLNSSVLRWYYSSVINGETGEALAQVKKAHIVRLPVKQLDELEDLILKRLVQLICKSRKEKLNSCANLFESLIDACVMECYFREHMAERDILFHDTVAEALKDYNPDAPEAEQITYLETLEARLKAAGIAERLARIPIASPDLLGVILKEGKV